MSNPLAILTVLGDIIAAPVKSWSDRKKIKTEVEMEVFKAKADGMIARAKSGDEHDFSMEELQLKNAGWKDEYWTIIVSIPLVLCFFDSGAPLVQRGFQALSETPIWYQSAAVTIMLSPFGVRFKNFIQSMRQM